MAVYCKIFLRFKNKFWEDDIDYIAIANSVKGYYPKWKPIKGQNIIQCTVTGEQAERIEKLSNNEIKNEV